MSDVGSSVIIVDRSRGRSWRDISGGSVLSPLGLRTVVVTDRPGGHLENTDSRTMVVFVDELSTAAIVDVTRELAGRFEGISTCSELLLESVAEVRLELGLPGPTPVYVSRLRDKVAMKSIAKAANIPVARGIVASEANALPSDLRGARLFAKPRALSGARGARELESAGDLRRFLDDVGHSAVDYLIEEFVEGDLFHLDGFVADGVMTAVLSRYARPTHVSGGATPLSSATEDDPALVQSATRFLRRVVRAWNIEQDVFHCEAFFRDDAFLFCEIAGRPGGAGVPEAFELVTGWNLRWVKTVLDAGLRLQDVPRVAPRAKAAGWTVIYDADAAETLRDLQLHVSADVRTADEPRVLGHAGVGFATYVFAGASTVEVGAQIEVYEAAATQISRNVEPDR